MRCLATTVPQLRGHAWSKAQAAKSLLRPWLHAHPHRAGNVHPSTAMQAPWWWRTCVQLASQEHTTYAPLQFPPCVQPPSAGCHPQQKISSCWGVQGGSHHWSKRPACHRLSQAASHALVRENSDKYLLQGTPCNIVHSAKPHNNGSSQGAGTHHWGTSLFPCVAHQRAHSHLPGHSQANQQPETGLGNELPLSAGLTDWQQANSSQAHKLWQAFPSHLRDIRHDHSWPCTTCAGRRRLSAQGTGC